MNTLIRSEARAVESSPFGAEVLVVNGHVVRVAFDTQRFRTGLKNSSQPIDGILGRRAKRGGAAQIESDFAKTDDQAFTARFDLDDMALDLLRQSFFQFGLDVLHWSAGRRTE